MASKPTRELYRGKAVIMGVSMEGVEDWKDWEKKNLSETDLGNAFKIVYDVAESDANGARHDIKIEISHRELSGKMLDYFKREDGETPTQIDFALRQLKQQGLVGRDATDEGGLAPALDDALCGREVTIRAYEEQSNDGKWWPRAMFASKFQRLTGAAKSERLAAFLAGKPAPKHEDAPAAASTAIPAPADDDIEMPF